MTQAFNLSQLANNLTSAGLLDASDGLINAVPVANGGTGATTASAARTNLGAAASTAVIPSGGIIMWSGSIASIPSGYFLCNGANGTPNLTDRFVICAGSTYAVAASGGSKDAVVVAHTHTGNTGGQSVPHTHDYNAYLAGATGFAAGSNFYLDGNPFTTAGNSVDHTHAFTTASSGVSGTNANLPPYYALAFIMKS